MAVAAVEYLSELQRCEDRERKLTRQLEGFPEKIAALDASLSEHRERVEKLDTGLQALRKNYRSRESETQDMTHQISQKKARLMSVKSNKEYTGILKEIETVESRISDVEDEMLRLLDEIETAETSLTDGKTALDAATAEVVAEKQELQRAVDETAEQLAATSRERDAVTEKIPQEFLDLFATVRQQTGDTVITPVINGACNACNITLPPQLVNDLRELRGELQESRHCKTLQYCPFCNRIIYFKDINE